MGLAGRISVIEGNILTADIPQVDLGLTETFAIGLLTEQGHKITKKLAGSATEILPSSSTIYACDDKPTANTFWQKAASIDFREENETVNGRLWARGTGPRGVYAYAAFYDARQHPIVTETGTNLTNPVYLGSVVVPHPDFHINFSYQLGSELHQTPALLSVEP